MNDSRSEKLDPSLLLPQVYDELRAMAAAYMRQERTDHTLEPTALVHEAWIKLAKLRRIEVRDRPHFLALAAGAMRQILVDHARAHRALKRGGGWHKVTMHDSIAVTEDGLGDVLVLDQALDSLARLDPKAARIVELRFFGGLTEDEVAQAMDMSERWVRQQWSFARAWMRREMLSVAGR